MTNLQQIKFNLTQCATTRAHLYGAESMHYKMQSEQMFIGGAPMESIGDVVTKEIAAKRRYWREVSAAATLAGSPWPEAQRLGGEA